MDEPYPYDDLLDKAREAAGRVDQRAECAERVRRQSVLGTARWQEERDRLESRVARDRVRNRLEMRRWWLGGWALCWLLAAILLAFRDWGWLLPLAFAACGTWCSSEGSRGSIVAAEWARVRASAEHEKSITKLLIAEQALPLHVVWPGIYPKPTEKELPS